MDEMWVERLIYDHESQSWMWKPNCEQFNLDKDFAINEADLSAEICRLGQLMVRYGGIAAEQAANLARKDEYSKLVYAQVSGAYRSQLEAAGQRPTSDRLKELAVIDMAYQQALSELHQLRADAVKADHWWRSIVKKADLVNALAYRQNAEIKRMD